MNQTRKINLEKLKNTLLIIFAMLFLSMPAYSLTLETGIEYTVDQARIVAFKDTELTIPTSEFSTYIYDIFYYSNIDAIKAGKLTAGIGFRRELVPFYNKKNKFIGYGVKTEDEPNKKFYYTIQGKLFKYEISTFNGTYPYKNIAYDEKGNFMNIHLFISEKESFIFDKDKKLLGHWLNDKCYDDKGDITLTRLYP
ncbi:hypothetical protein IKE67_01225 [bacterium]|nr:hypothetical protein [bacterium]